MEIKRENPASRQTRIAAFVRKNTVLLIALALAVLSIALVPPDEAYAGYYDLKTLPVRDAGSGVRAEEYSLFLYPGAAHHRAYRQ